MENNFFSNTLGLAFHANGNETIAKIDIENTKSYFRSQNEGHFIGLVKLLSGENSTLADHLKSCKELEYISKSNPTFLSGKFINKVLFIIRTHMVNKIVNEIKVNGNIYGLELDTSQDLTTIDQCSIVVRYVDDESNICERTVLFIESKNSTGKEIYKMIDKSLNDIGLSVRDISGFSFDGAGNLRSENKGVNHYIKKANPKSVYMWCYCHRYNLVIQKATSSFKIKYIIGNLK